MSEFMAAVSQGAKKKGKERVVDDSVVRACSYRSQWVSHQFTFNPHFLTFFLSHGLG
jgi:hypothetical protein